MKPDKGKSILEKSKAWVRRAGVSERSRKMHQYAYVAGYSQAVSDASELTLSAFTEASNTLDELGNESKLLLETK